MCSWCLLSCCFRRRRCRFAQQPQPSHEAEEGFAAAAAAWVVADSPFAVVGVVVDNSSAAAWVIVEVVVGNSSAAA